MTKMIIATRGQLIAQAIAVYGCILVAPGIQCHKKFDEPPVYDGPVIQANTAIRDLRAMHFPGNFEKIPDELIIEGIVVADDREDNFYKSIIVQDSTGGITIRVDGFGLYNFYPVGRKLWVKLKGLWLGDYAKMIQLGGAVDRADPSQPELLPIPQPLFDRYIVKGSLHNPVLPRTVRLDQLDDSLQSCLVKIMDAELHPSDTGKPYGDVVNRLSVNHQVKACGGGTAYLRSSGFAGFANAKTPRGNGSIVAVYSVFRTEKQLMIRDTADVRFDGLRCTGSGAKILLSEDFETTAPTQWPPTGWKNIAENGAKPWEAKLSGNNRYAEISAFASGQPAVVSWLLTPPVNLSNSANELLTFKTRDGFDNGGVLQVYASTNYDGGNTPWKAKWVLLKAVISKGTTGASGNDWVSSGNISLSGLSGTVHIAFRYDGADPVTVFDKRTTRFQLDEVKIQAN